MSAFEDKEETTESFLERIAKEKGEHWKDPEVLAKGKYEADQFIEQLKRQNAELLEDLKSNEKLDAILETLKSQKTSPAGRGDSDNDQGSSGSNTKSNAPSGDDVSALVKKLIAESEASRSKESNFKTVERQLAERFGDKANAVVKQAAADLDMTIDEVRALAETKPKAFMKLMGLDAPSKQTPGTMFNSGTRSEGTSTNGDRRDFAYYQKLRKESKSRYYTPTVQNQMMRDIQALGEAAFYGRS